MSHPRPVPAPTPVLAVLLVGLLGLLLGSFPARNLDVWRHLADARDLTRGAASPGPFWLYDLLTYAVFSAVGGAGLVALKALLGAATAVIVFRLARANGGWRLPLAATLLAALALGSRSLLQPATVSVFLLALAALVVSNEADRPAGDRGVWPGWRLVVLFVVWANVGGWVVLGLAVVGLTRLGRLLDAPQGRAGRAWGRRIGAFGILLVVACASPRGLNGLRPPEPLAAALRDGGSDSQAITSPFRHNYFLAFRNSPAALAYFPLLALGLLAFLLNRRGWRWAWFLPWLGLAAVSGLQARAIPFFAVIAGPVLAWNLQEVFARRGGLAAVRPRVRGATTGLAFATAAGLVVCAWPGWLQGPPFGPRQWTVEVPPALEHGAEFLRRTHGAGIWAPGTRTLHVSPDTAAAFAWFAPEDRGVLDDAVVGALLRPDDTAAARARLREVGVNRVVVHAGDPGPASLAVLARFLADPTEWPILHLTGGLVVFGWRDPDRPAGADPFRGWEMDFDRLAFRPDESEIAPPSGPGLAAARRWWEAFWKSPPPPRPPGRDEATVLLMKTDAVERTAPGRHVGAWESGQVGGLVAAAGGWGWAGGAGDAALRGALLWPPPPFIPTTFTLFEGFMRDRGDAPAGILYAAIRAARRAVAENPGDANTYLVLGRAYTRLLATTAERGWAARLPQLRRVRLVQASAALNRAAALNPALADAHFELGFLYPRLGCLDLAADHLRKYREIAARGGVRQKDPRAEGVEAELARLTELVERQTRDLADQPGRAAVADRADAADRRGLGGKALTILLGSDVSAFGTRGTERELDLLLRTGRPADVLNWLTPEVRGSLSRFVYDWLRAQALAAIGDYAGADEELAVLVGPGGRPGVPAEIAGRVSQVVGKGLLDDLPGGELLPHLAWRILGRSDFQTQLTRMTGTLAEQCDAAVLRGLVALEAGNIPVARKAFRSALTFSPDPLGGGQFDFNARDVALAALALLDRRE